MRDISESLQKLLPFLLIDLLLLYDLKDSIIFHTVFLYRNLDMDRNFSRRHAVEKFGEMCREVLSEAERLGLHKLLSDYHRRRRVERLVPGLFKVIQEENRMEVVHLLRQLIPYAHLSEFDRHIHQRRARGQLKTFFWEEDDDGIGTAVSFNSGVYYGLVEVM